MEENAAHQRVTRRISDVCAALNAEGARYLVMGGTACVLHGFIRYTKDVDILIEKSRDNVERILRALAGLGYGFAARLTPEEILERPITVIGDDPAVDIFWAGLEVTYPRARPNSVTIAVNGVPVPVIGLDDLILSKQTGRASDAADVEALEEIRRLRTTSEGPPPAR